MLGKPSKRLMKQLEENGKHANATVVEIAEKEGQIYCQKENTWCAFTDMKTGGCTREKCFKEEKTNMDNLRDQVPEEWFDEIPAKPEENIISVAHNLYESNCPELVGNFVLELFRGESGAFYMCRKEREPIGDYGSHWVDFWYRCNDDATMGDLIEREE
jgi:hypothetical protein